jgi:hypothetical protein
MSFHEPIDILPDYGKAKVSAMELQASAIPVSVQIVQRNIQQTPQQRADEYRRVQESWQRHLAALAEKEAAANLGQEEEGTNWLLIGGIALGATVLIGGGVLAWRHFNKPKSTP